MSTISDTSSVPSSMKMSNLAQAGQIGKNLILALMAGTNEALFCSYNKIIRTPQKGFSFRKYQTKIKRPANGAR